MEAVRAAPSPPRRPRAPAALPPGPPGPPGQPHSPPTAANRPPIRRPPSWRTREFVNQSAGLHNDINRAVPQLVPRPANQQASPRPFASQSESPRLNANVAVIPRPPTNHQSSPRNGNQAASHVQQAGQSGGGRGGGTGAQDPPNGVARIHVTGFPVYAQSQDLVSCFAQFGPARVERMTGRCACLAFPAAHQARAAILASRKLIVYGEFLTVREFSATPPDPPPQKGSPKRIFPRTKQKEMIVDPQEIDLGGDFATQMENVLARVRLTQEEAVAIGGLYADLERVLQAQWPGCIAMPFGSITTGLGIKTSDADCYVRLPGGPGGQGGQGGQLVQRAKRLLQAYPHVFAEILAIPRANTPIVKFFHVPTQTNCDLTFKTPLGSQNSKLIAFLLHSDPRLIPVAVIIKYWAKVHGFSGTGKLTNYALTMMIIFYLQQPPLELLPSVEWLQRDRRNDVIVDYWNTGFMANRELLPNTSDKSSACEMLGGFFQFYSTFNFDEMVVCPYLGTPVKKEMFYDVKKMPDLYQRYRDNVLKELVYPLRHNTAMCVQDPFEQSHNVASAISGKLAAEIKAYLKFAADAYEKGKQNGCKEFLKTILLQKPKLPKSARNHEMRVSLFPRLVMNIKDEDWRSVVRQVVCTIFETMLKIKLSKTEDRVNPKSKKMKERYAGTVTKAIWKRKQFSSVYIAVKLDFKEKQTKITEEIMKVEKETLNIPFHLVITYCSEPRSAAVALKQAEGDNEMFKEFARFFISVLQNWFVALLKPEAKPPAIDNAAKVAETIQILDGTNEPNTSIDSDDTSIANETPNSRESASEKDRAVVDAKEIANSRESANEKDTDVVDAKERANSRESAFEKDSAVVDSKETANSRESACEGDRAVVDSKEIANSRESTNEKNRAVVNAKETVNSRESANENDKAVVDAKETAYSQENASEKDRAVMDAKETANSRDSAIEKDRAEVNAKDAANCLESASEKDKAEVNATETAYSDDTSVANETPNSQESAIEKDRAEVNAKDAANCLESANEKDRAVVDAKETGNSREGTSEEDRLVVDLKETAISRESAIEKDTAVVNSETDELHPENNASDKTEDNGMQKTQ